MDAISQLLIFLHVFAGGTTLTTGLLAIILKKGGPIHRQIGKVYFWSMFTIFATAMLMLVLVRFNLFLLVVAIFSFYMSFSGYRVLRRKKLGEQTWIDWSGAIISLIAGIGIFIYGGLGLFGFINIYASALVYLCLFFGFFTAQTAWGDIKIFKKKNLEDKMWWLYHHIQAMVGSFIAAVTAFLVQNGQGLIPFPDFQWLIWVLPAMMGVPIITLWIRKYRRKYQVASELS